MLSELIRSLFPPVCILGLAFVTSYLLRETSKLNKRIEFLESARNQMTDDSADTAAA